MKWTVDSEAVLEWFGLQVAGMFGMLGLQLWRGMNVRHVRCSGLWDNW